MITNIKLIPKWGEGIGDVGVTTLRVTLNLSELLNALTTYDLYTQSVITVPMESSSIKKEKVMFGSVHIFRNVTEPIQTFEIQVIGHVKDTSQLVCKTTGYYIYKE